MLSRRLFILTFLTLVTLFLSACAIFQNGRVTETVTVLNFSVQDEQTKNAIPNAVIEVTLKDKKKKEDTTDSNGKAEIRMSKSEVPGDLYIDYTVSKKGYPTLIDSINLYPLPLKESYYIQVSLKVPRLILEIPSEEVELYQGEESKISLRVKNNGTGEATEVRLELLLPDGIIFKGWNLGKEGRLSRNELEIDTIHSNKFKSCNFTVKASEDAAEGEYEMIVRLNSKELPEISDTIILKVRKSLPKLNFRYKPGKGPREDDSGGGGAGEYRP